MGIVRLIPGIRVFVAAAVWTVLFSVPAPSAHAAKRVFAGECLVNMSFGGSFNNTSAGTWSGGFHFSSNSCVYAPSASTSIVGSGAVSGTIGPCGAGVYMGAGYKVTANMWTSFGLIEVVHEGATLTIQFVDDRREVLVTGQLAATSFNAAGCPNAWTGVLAVFDPALEEEAAEPAA